MPDSAPLPALARPGIPPSRAHSLVKGSAGLVALVGILVLVGWMRDIHPLTTFLLGPVTLKPNAAVGFLAAAGSLWLCSVERGRRSWARLVGLVLGWFVVLLGGLTLSQYLRGFDLGVDQLLIPTRIRAAVTGSVRMSPGTALCLVLLGAALLLLRRDRCAATAQLLALAAGVVALLVVLGYAYGSDLYQPGVIGSGGRTGMALHTALTMIVLVAGILAVRPDQGVMAVMTSGTPLGRAMWRVVLVSLTLPFLFGWLQLAGLRAGLYDPEFGIALWTGLTILAWGQSRGGRATPSSPRRWRGALARNASGRWCRARQTRCCWWTVMDRSCSPIPKPSGLAPSSRFS